MSGSMSNQPEKWQDIMRCEGCGDKIPRPVVRRNAEGSPIGIFCHECWVEDGQRNYGRKNLDQGAVADLQYHGGRFHGGEW